MRMSKNFVVRRLDGGVTLIPLVRSNEKTAYIYRLNDTASIILTSIQSGESVMDIETKLCKTYPHVCECQLKADIQENISDLMDIGVLEDNS